MKSAGIDVTMESQMIKDSNRNSEKGVSKMGWEFIYKKDDFVSKSDLSFI